MRDKVIKDGTVIKVGKTLTTQDIVRLIRKNGFFSVNTAVRSHNHLVKKCNELWEIGVIKENERKDTRIFYVLV